MDKWIVTFVVLILSPLGVQATPMCIRTTLSLQKILAAASLPPADVPRPAAVVHTEGTLPHAGIYDQSVEAQRDLDYMRDLAIAWQAARDEASLKRLAIYLDAWTEVYRLSFNPIDETRFDGLIEAYRLTAKDLPQPTVQRIRRFLYAMGNGYLMQMERHNPYTVNGWSNNWQSHRIKLVTLAAQALGDEKMFASARSAFITQLGINMKPDGEVADFRERDALHYVVYDLEPLIRAALAAKNNGEDWLNLPGHNGQTLLAGLDWLLPYAEGKRAHTEFVNSSVNFDAERAHAGLKGYSGTWPPYTASSLYWSASMLDMRYLTIAKSLASMPPNWIWAYGKPCE
ncbi:alginate lyase family protein [Agrobacterium sp. NPDC089420]|uniref:alginate lyase family protein n=1 Tax=Agrobacterium sp. NPDC089420 TaxID=3363918 RepID=UPI00384E41D0